MSVNTAAQLSALSDELSGHSTGLSRLHQTVSDWQGQGVAPFHVKLGAVQSRVASHAGLVGQAGVTMQALSNDLAGSSDPAQRAHAHAVAASRLHQLAAQMRATRPAGGAVAHAATDYARYYLTFTTVTAGTEVRENLPGHGRTHFLPGQHPSSTSLISVGVRYVVVVHGNGKWAMVDVPSLNHDRLHWGFVPVSALASHGLVKDMQGNPITTPQHAVSGHGANIFVPIQAAHAGATALRKVQVVSSGTLRDDPVAFSIGTVNPGDDFEIPANQAPVRGWTLGFDKTTAEWGWVQNEHLKT